MRKYSSRLSELSLKVDDHFVLLFDFSFIVVTQLNNIFLKCSDRLFILIA